MKVKVIEPNPAHQAFHLAFSALMKKHVGDLSAEELLALTANVVGRVLAFQDQRTMTTERAMQLIKRNIEQGNAEAITLHETQGSA
jgi:hypothetical protein